jgi:HAAS
LLGRLRSDPSTVRRILNETESHLRDAVDAGATAEVAIARFGDVDIIATCRPRGRGDGWLASWSSSPASSARSGSRRSAAAA